MTTNEAKSSLAVLYVVNLLAVFLMIAGLVSLYLFGRLTLKVSKQGGSEAMGDADSRKAMLLLKSHLSWIRKGLLLFVGGILVSAVISFGLGSPPVGLTLLLGASAIFLLMMMFGYFKLLINKHVFKPVHDDLELLHQPEAQPVETVEPVKPIRSTRR